MKMRRSLGNRFSTVGLGTLAVASAALAVACLRPPEPGAVEAEQAAAGENNAGTEVSGFLQSTWGDSSGKDGKGGTKLTASADGRLPLVNSDFDKNKRGDAVTKERSEWQLFHGPGTQSLAFEWTWVTKADDKFFGQTWGGGGVAFNRSWGAVDGTEAQYLVLWVKASHAGLDLTAKLHSTLKTKGKEDSGEVLLSKYVPGGQLATTWQRVVIPISEFPALTEVDLKGLQQVIFNVKAGQPENQAVAVYLDNMYLTNAEMVTPVSNLGYLVTREGVQIEWHKDPKEKVKEFAVSVAGKPVATAPAAARSLFVPNAKLGPAGEVSLALTTVGKSESSDPVSFKLNTKLPADVAATVQLGQSAHDISPHIFGINWGAGSDLAELGAGGRRWGGNRTTKYNWQEDIDSAGVDWFFLNDYGKPAGTKEEEKSYYGFIKESLAAKVPVNFAIPISPWIAKRHPSDGQRYCSFPSSVYPNQEKTDGQGCGNGRAADGKPIWDNDPNLGMTKNTPALQKAFVQSVVQHFGAANKGGVAFYGMDNEPGLWAHTHRDTVPLGISAETLADWNIEYANAVKSVDPSAKVIGFAAWGVKELAGSNLDFFKAGAKDPHKLPEDWSFQEVKKHGGDSQLVYLLKRFKQAEVKYGKRLIDVIDVHWYPELYANDSKGQKQRTLNDLPYDAVFTPVQFEGLREWWDPEFTPGGAIESWTFNPNPAEDKLWRPYHPVIPALKKLIETHYPGTQLAINEYDNGSPEHFHGALLRAAALGIFMQENLYMAQNWHQTGRDKFVFWAQKMFGNYDGQGTSVGGKFVPAKSNNQDLYSFAANKDGRWQVVLVNRHAKQGITTTVQLPKAAARARTFTLAESLGLRLLERPATISGDTLTVQVPPFSAVLLEAR